MIITRDEWGAAPATGSPYWMGPDVDYTVHWSGVTKGSYTPEQAYTLVKADQVYHMNNGWRDIAYNFLVDRHGQIFEGRGFDIANGANGTTLSNQTSIAVCLILGPGDTFTQGHRNGLANLRLLHLQRGGGTATLVHRDHVSTQCPGDEITYWVHNVLPSIVATPTVPLPEDDMFTDEDRAKLNNINNAINDKHLTAQIVAALDSRFNTLRSVVDEMHARVKDIQTRVVELPNILNPATVAAQIWDWLKVQLNK